MLLDALTVYLHPLFKSLGKKSYNGGLKWEFVDTLKVKSLINKKEEVKKHLYQVIIIHSYSLLLEDC